MNRIQLESIERYSEKQMARLGLWGWPHVQRVYRLSLLLAETQTEDHVDFEVLEAAALLHDIAKHVQERKPSIDHGLLGGQRAERYLRKCGFKTEKIDAITHAIRAHTRSEKANSIEAKILHDADFLDKLGAVGIATIFVKVCLSNVTIEEALKNYESVDLKRSLVGRHVGWLKNPHLFTKKAREIAEKRNKIASSFFCELRSEIELTDFQSDEKSPRKQSFC